jgi:hypothetical protein
MTANEIREAIGYNLEGIILAIILVRNFINNLLKECPHLKANIFMELIQGIFNAAVSTMRKGKN